MCDAIRSAGIIPFFRGPVPGFSIEELTPPEHWFYTSEELGPWDWKIAAVQSGDIAYGKFLCGGKAAFATVEWYAHLRNWRLSLPEFEPDAGGLSVLRLAAKQGSVSSADIRHLLNLKKAAADGVSSRLMHQCRLLIGDIERVYRGPSLKYSGWQHCSFCTPEALFSADVAPVGEVAPPSGVRPSGSPHHPFGTVPPLSHRGCDVPQGEHLPDSPSPAPLLFGGFSPFSAEDPLDVGCTPQESLAALLNHLRELLPSVSDAALMRLLR